MSKKNYAGVQLRAIIAMTLTAHEQLGYEQGPNTIDKVLELLPGEITNPSHCGNCGASLIKYEFKVDILCCLLLLDMAQVVRHKLEKGESFTSANQVIIPELAASHSVRCKTTIASKLGLVVQHKRSDGTKVSGVWVITARGWSFLRGGEVPYTVQVFRNKIEGRDSVNKITLPQVFALTNTRKDLSAHESSLIKTHDYEWYKKLEVEI